MMGNIIMGKQTIRICIILSLLSIVTGNDVPTNIHTFNVLKRVLKEEILEGQVLEERLTDADRENVTSMYAVKPVEKELEFRLPNHNYDAESASDVKKRLVKKVDNIVQKSAKASLKLENLKIHSANQVYQRDLESSCHVKNHCQTTNALDSCSVIVPRKDWSARDTLSASYMDKAVRYVFLHHTAMERCTDSATCISEMKKIQDLHMDTNGWDDIGYSFVVGEDGMAYEARGWNRIGAHTRGWNAISIAIAVMGNFNFGIPNELALEAINSLIECGISLGAIELDYVLYGHRDASGDFDSPGHKLYELMQEWPHFSIRTNQV